jgi:hypothetical protein
MRKQYEASFNAKVALEARKGEKPIAQLAGVFGVHLRHNPIAIERQDAYLSFVLIFNAP